MTNHSISELGRSGVVHNFRYAIDFVGGEEDYLSAYVTKVDLKFTGKKVKADFVTYLPVNNLGKNMILATSFNDVMVKLFNEKDVSDIIHIYDISTEEGDRDVYTGVSSEGAGLMELRFSIKGTWDSVPINNSTQKYS